MTNQIPMLNEPMTRNAGSDYSSFVIRASSLLLSLFAFTATAAHAQDTGTGLGVIVGEPTGFSIKHWLDERSAIDGAVGWAFDSGSSFHIHGDWLLHDYTLLSIDPGSLPVYYGVGARFKASSDGRGRGRRDRLGVRIPVGLAYHLEDRPLEIFAEIAPIMDVVPSTRLSLNAAIGIRWYFR